MDKKILYEVYVRELLNRAKTDDTIRLRGTKIDKAWRIDTQSIYEQLGINNSNPSYEKEIYIKELEQQIQFYRVKHELYKNKLSMIKSLIVIDNI